MVTIIVNYFGLPFETGLTFVVLNKNSFWKWHFAVYLEQETAEARTPYPVLSCKRRHSSILSERNTFPTPCPDVTFRDQGDYSQTSPDRWAVSFFFFFFKPGFGQQPLEFPLASQIFLKNTYIG